MVSSALDIEQQELLDTLERLRREHGDDPEYQELRAVLPADWPI
jgi:hypothetical protein